MDNRQSVSVTTVLYATPPHPVSKALPTISALLETGDEESMKGFLNLTPQKSTDKSGFSAIVLLLSS